MFESMGIFSREELVDLYKFYTEMYFKAKLANGKFDEIVELDKRRTACANAIQEHNWFVERN